MWPRPARVTRPPLWPVTSPSRRKKKTALRSPSPFVPERFPRREAEGPGFFFSGGTFLFLPPSGAFSGRALFPLFFSGGPRKNKQNSRPKKLVAKGASPRPEQIPSPRPGRVSPAGTPALGPATGFVVAPAFCVPAWCCATPNPTRPTPRPGPPPPPRNFPAARENKSMTSPRPRGSAPPGRSDRAHGGRHQSQRNEGRWGPPLSGFVSPRQFERRKSEIRVAIKIIDSPYGGPGES